MALGVSIIIPTWNGGEIFKKSLEALRNQFFEGNVELIVIDSGSKDGTPELAEKAMARVIRIDQRDFHHSRTRNKAVSYAQYDKVVMFVQDAIPSSDQWLSNLVNSLEKHDVDAAYGRQLPHDDADLYARFEVEFHSEYLGEKPVLQSIASEKTFYNMNYEEALRAVRFDNVCAIYKRDLLLKHPFPDIPFAEDMAWAKEVILKGYKVLYDPNVQVKHSHNRPANYRFRRAIVDTVACAEILERAKNDMSFLTDSDLYAVSQILEEKLKVILEQLHAGKSVTPYRGAGLANLKAVIRKFPIIKRMFWSMLKYLGKSSNTNSWVTAYALAAEQHMRFVLQELHTRYPSATITELSASMEQVSASLQGGVFGEVFASYKNKGTVPNEIHALIAPHMKGV